MNTVDQIIYDIIGREGGYSNRASDRGGPTKYGITQRTLSTHLGRNATIDEVKNLDKKTAFEILYQRYYLNPNLDTLPAPLQPVITDMAVNHGPRKAISMLQDELAAHAFNPGKVDGVCGAKTATAARLAWDHLQDALITCLVNRRVLFYRAIIENDPSQAENLNGWLNRAHSFLA